MRYSPGPTPAGAPPRAGRHAGCGDGARLARRAAGRAGDACTTKAACTARWRRATSCCCPATSRCCWISTRCAATLISDRTQSMMAALEPCFEPHRAARADGRQPHAAHGPICTRWPPRCTFASAAICRHRPRARGGLRFEPLFEVWPRCARPAGAGRRTAVARRDRRLPARKPAERRKAWPNCARDWSGRHRPLRHCRRGRQNPPHRRCCRCRQCGLTRWCCHGPPPGLSRPGRPPLRPAQERPRRRGRPSRRRAQRPPQAQRRGRVRRSRHPTRRMPRCWPISTRPLRSSPRRPRKRPTPTRPPHRPPPKARPPARRRRRQAPPLRR